MSQTVVSNYQIDKSCRLTSEKRQFGQAKTHGAYLGKYKVSISIQFTTSNPVIKAGTNDVSSTEADLHIELAIVVDWKSSVEPDPASSEAVDLTAVIQIGSNNKFSGFYFSGSVTELLDAFEGNKSIQRFCGGDSQQLISLQAFEDVLVSKFADLILVAPDAVPQTGCAAYWHVTRVCIVPLQATTLFHNMSPFPLIHTGLATTFDLVTNIDRNSLYPSYAHFDGLVGALLNKLSQQMKPSQYWATLVLDQYTIKSRLATGAEPRLEYEKAACELLLRQFERELSKKVKASRTAPLTFVTLLQVSQESSGSSKQPLEATSTIEQMLVDVASIISEDRTGRSRLLQASKFLVLSKFPGDDAPKKPSATENADPSTTGTTGLTPPASPVASRGSSSGSQNPSANTQLYEKTKRKFGQILQETHKLNTAITASAATVVIFNPFISVTSDTSRTPQLIELAQLPPKQTTDVPPQFVSTPANQTRAATATPLSEDTKSGQAEAPAKQGAAPQPSSNKQTKQSNQAKQHQLDEKILVESLIAALMSSQSS